MTCQITTVLVIALGAALLGLGGCASASKQTALMDEMGVTDVSARELRLRVYDYGLTFSAEVEQAADFIMSAAADPDIERRALLWKVNAITVMNQAVFQIDPLAAVIDATAFSYQMRAFFADGAGQDLFGPWQPVALAVSDTLQKRSIDMMLAAARARDVPAAREFVMAWSEANPIENLLFVRRSTTTQWAHAVTEESVSAMSAVVHLDASFDDLLARMRIYAGELPKQARWQAELAALNIMEERQIQEFLGAIDAIEVDIDSIEIRFDEFVIMVDAMYSEAWQHLAVQQSQATDDANAMLATALAGITAEREAVMAVIMAERLEAMAQAETQVRSVMAEAVLEMRGLVDHLVWRLAQLLAGFLVAAGLVGWAVLRFGRR